MDYTQSRINKLLSEGFTIEEAEYLSSVPVDTPEMRKIRRYRKMQIREVRKAGIEDSAQIRNYIYESYRAQGWTDDNGRIQPDRWYSTVSDEVMKPYRDRKNYAIQPNLYNQYEIIKSDTKLSPLEVNKLIDMYPPDEWAKRANDYNYLIRNHYNPEEATKIVYAWTRDGRLQSLNLNNPAWQETIAERNNWWNDYIKNQISRGRTKEEAIRYAKIVIQDFIKSDKEAPWKNLDIISPTAPAKPKIDFVNAMEQRRLRLKKQREEKMPYRVGK